MSPTCIAQTKESKPFDLKDGIEQDSGNAAPNQSDRCVCTLLHKWLQDGKAVVREAQILCVALRDPRVPLRAKMIAGPAAAYIFVQLLPTFIPVIDQLDDLCALWIGSTFLRKLTPPAVMKDCEARGRFGKTTLKRSGRFSQAFSERSVATR
jgi:uncharacterized membrane protein YkvA (DUF1232 family)